LAAELVLPSLCVADLSHFFRFASRIAFGKAIPECYAESWMKPWAEHAIATITKLVAFGVESWVAGEYLPSYVPEPPKPLQGHARRRRVDEDERAYQHISLKDVMV